MTKICLKNENGFQLLKLLDIGQFAYNKNDLMVKLICFQVHCTTKTMLPVAVSFTSFHDIYPQIFIEIQVKANKVLQLHFFHYVKKDNYCDKSLKKSQQWM